MGPRDSDSQIQQERGKQLRRGVRALLLPGPYPLLPHGPRVTDGNAKPPDRFARPWVCFGADLPPRHRFVHARAPLAERLHRLSETTATGKRGTGPASWLSARTQFLIPYS